MPQFAVYHKAAVTLNEKERAEMDRAMKKNKSQAPAQSYTRGGVRHETTTMRYMDDPEIVKAFSNGN